MSERNGLQFSLFGIPVRIELWFFVIPLLALQNRDARGALIWTVLVFTGVMLHELGHALAMRSFGFSPRITLHAMGGLTHFPQGARVTPRQNFFITLAGPGAGLTLGLSVLAFKHFVVVTNPDLALALEDALWINIGWSIVNLLPILPWDGGLILDSALHWATGKRRDRVVAISSLIGGALIIAVAVKTRMMLLGYFGMMGLIQGYQRWTGPQAAAPAATQLGEDERQLQLEALTSHDPNRRAALLEQIAWLRLKKGDFAGARRAVSEMNRAPSVSLAARLAASQNDVETVITLLSVPGAASVEDRPLLLAALISKERFDDAVVLARANVELAHLAATRLFEARAYPQSLELCTSERMRTGEGIHAYNEACCFCHLGRLDDAVTALQKAKALGFKDLRQLQTDKDLEPVRDRPEVQALMTS